MESFRQIMDIVGTSVDGVGVFIVVGGALFATVRLAFRRMRGTGNYYMSYRQDVGRARKHLKSSKKDLRLHGWQTLPAQ